MPKKRYWIAMAEHGEFTPDDHHVFRVFFTGQKNDSGTCLIPRFIEAEDFEEARSKLHEFVDDRIDHALHMLELDEVGREREKRRKEFMSKPIIPDEDINSLSIGGFVGEPPPPKPKTGGSFDLENFL